jgi:GNAT superfamily N-acetyltransferase
MITVKHPGTCTPIELEEFAALVRAGGEVESAGLDDRVKRARALLCLTEQGCTKGIAALKSPSARYTKRVFQKAQAAAVASEFKLELGWVFVLPSARGAGLAHELVVAALGVADGCALFATTRSDNVAMLKVLKAHDFVSHGKVFASQRGDHHIVLLLRHAITSTSDTSCVVRGV